MPRKNVPAPDLYLHLLAHLEQRLEVLPDKPDETPATTLNCLWARAAGLQLTVAQALDMALADLDEPDHTLLWSLVEQRLSGVPLAYIVGRQEFMGVVLTVTQAALVPRRETELLGRVALAEILASRTPNPIVVDLCTGCGNLALALAIHAPQARVWGSDICQDAVTLARANAEFVGRPDVTFLCGDLAQPFDTDAFRGRVDVLTCNAPYISSTKVDALHEEIRGHEPRKAFDGGPFGINILRRLFEAAPRLLRPGGWLTVEIGLGQGEALARRLGRSPRFDEVRMHQDERGGVRVLSARTA